MTLPVAKGDEVRAMFDGIAPTYDTLNHLLTLGLDLRWRRQAVRALAPKHGGHYLDLCAGTLDLSAELLRQEPQVQVTAVDYAPEMLAAGAHKVDSAKVCSVVADASELPLEDGQFDGALCGFGMRNLADLDAGLGEILRVLKPGAPFVVLEFFRPRSTWERSFHGLVNRRLVPLLGRLLSGDGRAYSYLGASMEAFDSRATFLARAEDRGFQPIAARRLFPGVASLAMLRVPGVCE